MCASIRQEAIGGKRDGVQRRRRSLGCSKNRVDTELMLGILRKAGYRITADEREADILIVNTADSSNRPSRRASIRCCPWQGINRKGSSSCWRPPAAWTWAGG